MNTTPQISQITQENLKTYFETYFKTKQFGIYEKKSSIYVCNTEEYDDFYLKNIDTTSPTSLKTNSVICCTSPTSPDNTHKNYYAKTLEQHNKQHIPIENGSKYNLYVPLIDNNNIELYVNLDFEEVNTNTRGIPFKYDENNNEIVKLFELFETYDIIAPWNEIFNKDDIKNKIIFAKLENNNIVEIYIIENNPNNPIFDNTFEKTTDYYTFE